MAIAWEVKIGVLNVAEKRASITATRTDSADLDNPSFYSIDAIIATQAQKTAALNQIWAMHQASLSRQAQIDAVVGNLEAQAKDNLEARE